MSNLFKNTYLYNFCNGWFYSKINKNKMILPFVYLVRGSERKNNNVTDIYLSFADKN